MGEPELDSSIVADLVKSPGCTPRPLGIDWETTEQVLEDLATAVAKRRKVLG